MAGQAGRRPRLSDAAWAALESLLYPMLLLGVTPMLAAALQPEGFGLWTLYLAVVAIGSAASAGTATAISTVIAQCVGEGRQADIPGHVRDALSIAGVRSGALALLLAVVSVPLSAGFERLGPMATVATVCVAGVAVAWLEQLDQVHAAVWKGLEAFASAARAEVLLRVLQVAVLVAGVAAGAGVVVLIGLHLLASILRLVIKRHWVLQQFPALNPVRTGSGGSGGFGGSGEPGGAGQGEVLRRARWGWVQGISGLAFGSADRLLVGALLGPVAIAQYSVGMQLCAQIHAIIAAALSILAPAVGRLKARGDAVGSLPRRLIAFAVGAALVSAAGYLLLVLAAPSLIVDLLGWQDAGDPAFMAPLALAFFLLSLNVVPFHALAGFGRMHAIAVVCAGAGVLSTVLAILLVPGAGLAGAAWSRVAYALLALALLPILASSLRRGP